MPSDPEQAFYPSRQVVSDELFGGKLHPAQFTRDEVPSAGYAPACP